MVQRFGRYLFPLVLALMQSAGAHAAGLPPVVYAAGSLRSGLDEIVAHFASRTGISFDVSYQPSGKLRKDIESGARPEAFASAAIAHTDALFREGYLRNSVTFARNNMCLLAAPGVDLGQGSLLSKMLDPALRLGTSTPQVDPAGDYAWQVFHKAEALQSGAYDQLNLKAMQLLGNPAIPAQATRSIAQLLRDRQVDLFLTYCSYAEKTAAEVPGVTWRKLDEDLNVETSYGIGALSFADDRADRFINFILSMEGQKILARHGFMPVKSIPDLDIGSR
jgi:molybdenum ABC transporter molybdate-binding protein